MRKFLYLSPILFFCTPLPETVGRLQDVYLFSDYADLIKEPISAILGEEVLTPQPEKIFHLRYRPLSQFLNFSKFHTVLLVGTISDTLLEKFLGQNKAVVERDTYAFFLVQPEPERPEPKPHLFLFVAKDREGLKSGLMKYKERIRYSLEDRLSRLIHSLTYSRGENEKIATRLKEKYGFSIKVPKGFYLQEKYGAGNFIYLFAHYPDRSLFFYWAEQEREITPNEIILLRDSLTALYYDGDYVARKYTTYTQAKFLNRPAIKLQGVWQNDKEVIGGPFVSYAFNFQGRFYLIDGTLFNPGKKKLKNLLQLSVILSTFQVD